MTADIIQPGKIEIGRVISQTFGVIGRNFVTFFLVAFVLSGVPTAVIGLLQASIIGDAATGGSFNPATVFYSVMGVLAAVITASVLQGALVYGTVQDLNGMRPKIGECLATGLRAFLPLLAVSILFTLAVAGGSILLIVPGIMIACAWCVAVPCLVADRTSIGGAFRRSAELTRGNRWRIFGLFLVVLLILLVLSVIVGVLAMIPMMSGSVDPEAMAASPSMIVINTVSSTLSSMLGSAGAAVLYVELRRAREGAGPQWLSEIFS